MIDSTSNSLPSPFKTMALPITSPNSKLSLTSPKRGQKREEGWKEVVRRLAVVLCCLFTLQPFTRFSSFTLYARICRRKMSFFLIQHQTCFDLWVSVDVNYNPQFPSARIESWIMKCHCFLLKIKEAVCASLCRVSDHGQRRLQHHSHPGRDGSSHWRRQTEGQERGEDDHHKVQMMPSGGQQTEIQL